MIRPLSLSLAAAAIIALLLGWSAMAPWAAAFRTPDERYEIGLFGVRHITGVATGHSVEQHCGWGDRDPACAAAPGGERAYAMLRRAQWVVGGGAVALVAAVVAVVRRKSGGAAALFGTSALLIAVAVLIVRNNVGDAIAVLSALQTSANGSGIVAAEVAACVSAVSALVLARATRGA